MPFVFTEWQELPEPIVSLSCRKFVRSRMSGLVLVGAPPLATDTQIVNTLLMLMWLERMPVAVWQSNSRS